MHRESIMQEFPINWFTILAAVIIKQAIGAFWYSPALFGPSWCKLTGVSETARAVFDGCGAGGLAVKRT
jgi:hypothetical protein